MPGMDCASSGAEASITESPIDMTFAPRKRTGLGPRPCLPGRYGPYPALSHHGSAWPVDWVDGGGCCVLEMTCASWLICCASVGPVLSLTRPYPAVLARSEEHTSELQSLRHL